MIEINHLNKKFGSLKVLVNLNLTIKKGETIAIVGPSGCGKSTLLNCITGLDKEYQGEIIINGLNSKEYLKNNRVSIVLQKYSNFEWQTVVENVNNAFKNLNYQEQEQSKIIQNLINKTGLKGFENSYMNELSGGMQQRVAVTRAIAQQNEILALDEPFGALDISNRRILQELFLSEVAKQKSTAIFVTHDINEAILVSNRILCFTKRNNEYKIFDTNTLTMNTSSSVNYLEKQKEIIKYLTNGK